MTIKQQVLSGRLPEGLRIFDAHAHLSRGELSSAFLYLQPPEEALRLSRRIGIGGIAASSLMALGGQPHAANEQIIEFAEEFPDQVFAYIFYSAREWEQTLADLKRYRTHKNFIGVKMHPRDDHTRILDADYEPLYEYCAQNDILILCHTWQTEPANDPADFAPVLARHPKLKLLLGHMGGTKTGCYASIALANQYENVYLDINGSLYSEIWIEELVKKAPLEKFIFSTDQVFNDPRIITGRVLLSDLPDEAKRKILYDNFARVMGWPL